jgi:serine/threonine protein kinase
MRARDYQPGEQVPGTVYAVVRLIGVGGMGTVYDVEDTTIGKRYVLRTLHPQLGAREDLARRIQNEARTLARLNHPNIVEVITAGVTADDLRLPYYVMERLNGQSLRVVREKKGPLEVRHAYRTGIDLPGALDHAHGRGSSTATSSLTTSSAPHVGRIDGDQAPDFGIVSVLDALQRHGRALPRPCATLRPSARGEMPTAKMDPTRRGSDLRSSRAGASMTRATRTGSLRLTSTSTRRRGRGSRLPRN